MSKAFDHRKQTLKEKSENLKTALAGDFENIKQNSLEVGKTGLMALGVLAAGYITYKLLSSGSDEQEHAEHDNSSSRVIYVNNPKTNPIVDSIVRQTTNFALNLAKEKLEQFLKEKALQNSDEQ